MPSLIYTDQRSRKSKRQLAIMKQIANERRQAKRDLRKMQFSEPLKVRYASSSTDSIPSVPDSLGVAARKESPKYTGTYVIGIGQMHKSNAIPITNPEHAVDIARMRRG